MKNLICFFAAVAMIFALQSASAFVIPEEDSQAPYFYVFGPGGDPDLGAEGSEQTLYIDVPQDAVENMLFISVYDPDTGGHRDLRPDARKPWDTVTQFSVYGKDDKLLYKHEFGESAQHDKNYYDFGSLRKEEGAVIGGYYRFKLVAKTIRGHDENIYKVKISPESAQAFSYTVAFRLLPKEDQKMYFYPEVPAGTKLLVVENYDIDPNGGWSRLYDPELGIFYKVNDSSSSQWAQTALNVSTRETRRFKYIVTKKTQHYANAAVRFRDADGNLLPIYFKDSGPSFITVSKQVILPEKEEPAVAAVCNNQFTFDATKSYDPQNRQLAYRWDFGDGATSGEPVVSHTYNKAGEYAVKLMVRNDSGLPCDNAAVSQTVKVNAAPEAAFTAPEKACIGQEIELDASATKDDVPDKLTYHWDFGDGTTGQGLRVSKAYSKQGIYKVSLTANDNEGTPCSVVSKKRTIEVVSPVVANAGEDIDLCIPADRECRAQFHAGRSKVANEANVTYGWDFGDGTSGEGKNVSHVYKQAGTYQATLTVDDGGGLLCSTSKSIVGVKFNRQPVAIAGGDQVSCTGSEIYFDGAASHAGQGEQLSYSWNFGDGVITNGKTVTHTYQKSGKYYVTLTVDNGGYGKCSTGKDTLIADIYSRPLVRLAKAGPVCVNSEVNFNASGSSNPDGGPLQYTWNFGDGTFVTAGPKVSHAYKAGGEYTATVTVEGQPGVSCARASQSIKVRVNRPPLANAGPNMVCCVDTISHFDASGSSDPDGDSLAYLWNFGDGATARGQKVTHKYTKLGNYTVTLTVKDDSGTPCDTATASFEARVSDNPVSIMEVR